MLTLCRLALGLVWGFALAAPSLADVNPPPPSTIHAVPRSPQADWKLLTRYDPWKPEKRNRIFYARVPGQIRVWKYHIYDTYGTRKALHQNFGSYGLLAIFVTSWTPGSTIEGVDAGEGVLTVRIRIAPPPAPPDCSPQTAPGGPDVGCTVAVPGPRPQYLLLAIRKDSLPAPVQRLYISESA